MLPWYGDKPVAAFVVALTAPPAIDNFFPVPVIFLHWSSGSPIAASGAYLSARFPPVHGIAVDALGDGTSQADGGGATWPPGRSPGYSTWPTPPRLTLMFRATRSPPCPASGHGPGSATTSLRQSSWLPSTQATCSGRTTMPSTPASCSGSPAGLWWPSSRSSSDPSTAGSRPTEPTRHPDSPAGTLRSADESRPFACEASAL